MKPKHYCPFFELPRFCTNKGEYILRRKKRKICSYNNCLNCTLYNNSQTKAKVEELYKEEEKVDSSPVSAKTGGIVRWFSNQKK